MVAILNLFYTSALPSKAAVKLIWTKGAANDPKLTVVDSRKSGFNGTPYLIENALFKTANWELY